MSQMTRRNGSPSVPSTKPTSHSPPRSQSSPASKPSPYILLIYPVVLCLGSLFSIISPSASASTYATPMTPGVASDINTPATPQAFNYFAGKGNVFNLYFVKLGWFWTTLAFVLLRFTTSNAWHGQKGSPGSETRQNAQSLFRYALITVSWFLTTQWFFGPALIDRSFTSTGGRCVQTSSSSPYTEAEISTGLACKAAGGTWHGGHDVSGHFFMLVLSSAFLFLEFHISDLQSPLQSSHPHVSPAAAAEIANHATEQEKRAVGGWESGPVATSRLYTHYFVWLVIALDLWMLLMTAIWFHTLFEKVSGLTLATTCAWAIYFLPRFSYRWRGVVGGV